MFDTHCHLSANAFKNDLPEVIKRAQDAGVESILCVGLDAIDSLKCAEIAHRYDLLYTAGIHPAEALNYQEKDLNTIYELTKDDKCRAIGEIGLDYKPGLAPIETQQSLFRNMLDIAAKRKKPIIIHNRLASEDILKIITEINPPNKGVFHCFNENITYAEKIIEVGYYISFTGNVTYNKSLMLDIAIQIPLYRLMLETDAPYQTPIPHRGKRNEPAYLAYTLKMLAQHILMDLNELDAITTQNAKRLFL